MNKPLIFIGTAIGLGLLANAAKAASPPGGTANIVAVEPFTVDKTTCQGGCAVNGVATWKNKGDAAADFMPQISASGVFHTIGSVTTMQPGDVHTVTFSLPITVRTELCPVPGFEEQVQGTEPDPQGEPEPGLTNECLTYISDAGIDMGAVTDDQELRLYSDYQAGRVSFACAKSITAAYQRTHP